MRTITNKGRANEKIRGREKEERKKNIQGRRASKRNRGREREKRERERERERERDRERERMGETVRGQREGRQKG